jgi:hypothetical protein
VYKSIFAMGDYAGSDLPLVAEPEGRKSFALKTRLRYYYDCATLYTEAYLKVSEDLMCEVYQADQTYRVMLTLFFLATVRKERKAGPGPGIRWQC